MQQQRAGVDVRLCLCVCFFVVQSATTNYLPCDVVRSVKVHLTIQYKHMQHIRSRCGFLLSQAPRFSLVSDKMTRGVLQPPPSRPPPPLSPYGRVRRKCYITTTTTAVAVRPWTFVPSVARGGDQSLRNNSTPENEQSISPGGG